MSPGDALTAALAGTMALMLASRSLRSLRLPFKVKAGMALVWALVIISAAMIAAWWQA